MFFIKKSKILIIILLILIPMSLFAYRPCIEFGCGIYQRDLFSKIMKYCDKEKIEIKSIYPGKDFDNLYNKLLDKKYFKEPLKYRTADCSFGITIISGSPEIYCKYHGNIINTREFESINSSNNYYRNHYLDVGIVILVCCVFIGICNSIVKTIIQKFIKLNSK